MENPIPAPSLLSYPRYRPDLKRAPFLPMTRAEMDALGWDACDIIVVTGDAYIDHPSFGMALIGRTVLADNLPVEPERDRQVFGRSIKGENFHRGILTLAIRLCRRFLRQSLI